MIRPLATLKAGSEILKTRALLLSSCWKHYGMLLHLEDKKFTKQYKELLDQYLSGVQVRFIIICFIILLYLWLFGFMLVERLAVIVLNYNFMKDVVVHMIFLGGMSFTS